MHNLHTALWGIVAFRFTKVRYKGKEMNDPATTVNIEMASVI